MPLTHTSKLDVENVPDSEVVRPHRGLWITLSSCREAIFLQQDGYQPIPDEIIIFPEDVEKICAKLMELSGQCKRESN